jgi:hypothetical protein
MSRLHRNGNSPDSSSNGRPAAPDAASNGRPVTSEAEIRIRPLTGDDDEALRRLAQRDSARTPSGAVVGAERDGDLLAAISQTGGEVVADPFHPTADLVTLLRTWFGRPFPPLA